MTGIRLPCVSTRIGCRTWLSIDVRRATARGLPILPMPRKPSESRWLRCCRGCLRTHSHDAATKKIHCQSESAHRVRRERVCAVSDAGRARAHRRSPHARVDQRRSIGWPKGPVIPRIDVAAFRSELADFDFQAPRPLDELLSWTIEQMEHGLVHVTHPRYFGLFNPAPTFPAQCADRIAGAFNPQLATCDHLAGRGRDRGSRHPFRRPARRISARGRAAISHPADPRRTTRRCFVR